MKKIVLTLAFAGLIIAAKAEKSAYIAKMKETLEEMKRCQSAEDFIKVANVFERISKTEQNEWLPLYYVANIHVILVYVDPQASLVQKDQYLDKAESCIKRLEALAPEEAEIQVMKAFVLASRMGLDPGTRGATMFPTYEAALNKAHKLNANNPRVRYMLLSKDVGQAQWFGQSIEPYCPSMKKLYEEWDAYTPVSEIHPVWGKEQVAQLLEACD